MCRSNILEKNQTKRNGTDAWRESRMKEGRKEGRKEDFRYMYSRSRR
jgi:hypothetical protein